jgi:putative effector of murein hydrolase LrgA (UPF0299 family)
MTPEARDRPVAGRVAAVAVGCLPIAAAVAVGAGVERVIGIPTVVAGLVALTAALVASPRLLEVTRPAADVLLRLLPALFVPLVAGVAGAGDQVLAAWPAAVAAVLVSVPVGFLVTAALAGRDRRPPS